MGTEDTGYVGNLDPPLLQSFHKHLLSTACMPGIVLGNTAADKKKKMHNVLAPCGTDIPAGETDSEQEKYVRCGEGKVQKMGLEMKDHQRRPPGEGGI